jgi:putative hemolysin
MEDYKGKIEPVNIDVGKVLTSKNPALGKVIPGFIFRYLKRIVHQDEINYFLAQNSQLKNQELVASFLEFLKIKYTVTGAEKIPTGGRYIFVSNHPLGGLDGVVFINELSKYFNDIKFPVNDILTYIGNMSGIFLPINKHGSQGREAAKLLEAAYDSECQILYFPAGLCSRKKRGKITDLQWHKSIITKAVHHKRDIVPAYFSGRNSDFFYNLSSVRKRLGIKANIEMLYLADEMFLQKDKEIHLVFGEKIPWHTFDKSKTPPEWAEFIKSKCYELSSAIPVKK